MPVETLSGDGGSVDYEAALTASVVGQAEAVQVVATELKLIKAGLTERDRPASVLLFAGMTGVGKTELAKALAPFVLGHRETTNVLDGRASIVGVVLGRQPGANGSRTRLAKEFSNCRRLVSGRVWV